MLLSFLGSLPSFLFSFLFSLLFSSFPRLACLCFRRRGLYVCRPALRQRLFPWLRCCPGMRIGYLGNDTGRSHKSNEDAAEDPACEEVHKRFLAFSSYIA